MASKSGQKRHFEYVRGTDNQFAQKWETEYFEKNSVTFSKTGKNNIFFSAGFFFENGGFFFKFCCFGQIG